MRPQAVHVMPWLWNLRAVMYIGFAVPGFLMLTQPTPLLPPFMGALIFFAAGVLNLISCFGVLPNEKEWAWPWFGETKANKAKKEEEGAKFDTFFDLVIMCPYRTCCTAFEQNTLGRSLFLAVYFSLNVVLFIHAYDRHGNSNKDYRRQGEVLTAVADQVRQGSTSVLGVMLESNLVEGNQKLPADLSQLAYGQSITDACIDLSTTEQLLEQLAAAVPVPVA